MKIKSPFFVRVSLCVLIVLILIGGLSASVLAQSEPEATLLASTITYQGYLEQNAVPFTGTCDMTFSLFDAFTAGTQIGSTLSPTNVPVSGGIFIVQLDFGAAAFNGQDRYLSVSVRCPSGVGVYTPLTPRQPITPVPAAIYASNGGGGGGGGGDGWALTGNAATNPATNFVGTTDNQPLEFRVNSSRVMRYEPNATSPNIVGGYSGNSITAGVSGGFVGGGGQTAQPNLVTDDFGVVIGGQNNQAGDGGGSTNDRVGAAVVGGTGNQAQGYESFVGGGQGNIAGGIRGVIVGGTANSVFGAAASVGGGSGNTAGGDYATIPGGRNNVTSATYGFAAGRRAISDDVGAFVWGDSTDADVNSLGANSFTVRASGGTTFYSNAEMTTGVQLPAGGGAWAALSDQNVKENLQTVDTRAVLELLATLPISTWNYISQDDSIRHMGVMAQDFYAAFGIGEDDRHITTIDADGVAFAAIQGLYNVVQQQNVKLDDQAAAIAALQAHNAQLETRLSALEGLAQPESASSLPWALLALAGWISFGKVRGALRQRR